MLVPMQFILVMIRDWLVLGSSVSGVFWKSVLMFTDCLSAMFLSTSCWLSLSTTFKLMFWVCNRCVSVIFVNIMPSHCCVTWLKLYLINTRIFLPNILFLLRLHLIPTGSPDGSFEMLLVHQLLYALNFGSLNFCLILSALLALKNPVITGGRRTIGMHLDISLLRPCVGEILSIFFSSLRFSVTGWKFFPFSTWPAFTFLGKLHKFIASKLVSIVCNYRVWDNICDEMLYCFVWNGHCGSVWQFV